MRLLMVNGSPRGKKSNTKVLFEHFTHGVLEQDASFTVETAYLNKVGQQSQVIEQFTDADLILIGFPLYTDAMPGIVMNFFEQLPESKGKKVGFLVQSGFPEAYQSLFIEKYLKKLSARMQWNYLGTIIKGGVEGIQVMPEKMTKKLFDRFSMLGVYFGKTQCFDMEIIEQLRQPLRFSPIKAKIAKQLVKTGLFNFYWNKKLKENNAYNNRFNAPYVVDGN